jgi:hypothetical protein
MSSGPFKSFNFSPIEDRETALKIVEDCFKGFLTLAALQTVIGAFLMKKLIIDGVLIAGLACGFKLWKSRVAAILLLAIGLVAAGTTVASLMGVKDMGGRNIFLAALFVYTGIRSVQAAFALRKFPEDGVPPVGDAKRTAAAAARPVPVVAVAATAVAAPAAERATAPAEPVAPVPPRREMPRAFSNPRGRNIYD